MSISWAHHAIDTLRGAVYVMGGQNHNEQGNMHVISECEAFDLDSESWIPIPNMWTARYDASCCWFGDKKIYVFGGYTTTGLTDSIEAYNVEEYQWESLSVKLAKPLSLPCCIQNKENSILVMGGLNEEWISEQAAHTIEDSNLVK